MRGGYGVRIVFDGCLGCGRMEACGWIACGHVPERRALRFNRNGGVAQITADRAGTIASINVPDELHGTDGVEEVELYLKPSNSIETPHSSNDRIGHVVCSSADADEATARAEWALREIEVEIA